jgi:hypothetical protein
VAQKSLWRAVVILGFSFVLCLPAEAQKRDVALSSANQKPIVSTGEIVGILVAAVAVVAVVAYVVVHESTKKRTITGCARSGANGLTVSDEKDGQIYALSGNTAGITPGDRVKLHGKRHKGPHKTLTWEATSVARDFGVCQP